ncbi:hypothetical protein HRG_008344 [Hirsutella rhossiliensis]|uniref:Uncharacterized protein n=1 Tax=Hirsutella rhossiliensis TaxID=111463 RepID=A0A9P8MS76_9HYPO|nr:uncharacterized protein HRG_08344 [Hirsutella rhossiliensis]KAH0960189.1 hypothetical protein HRG_08344 [Hirsutella rhossiliensis]
MRKGTEGIRQSTRLLWPSPLLAVGLVTDQEFHAERRPPYDYGPDGGAGCQSRAMLVAVGHGVGSEGPVDFVPPDMCQDILIQKPYATILSVLKRKPTEALREAGSPFLLCFPRGVSENRLYGVFPRSDAADNQLRAQLSLGLPLIQSRPSKQVDGRGRLTSTASDGASADHDIYGAVVVFKKRRSLPPRFFAVCLAHVPRTDKNGAVAYEPGCKVIHGWTPRSFKARGHAAAGVRPHDLGQTDADADVLVTVQRRSVRAAGRQRAWYTVSSGLTQVVFDRRELAKQARLSSPNASAAPGTLAFMGKACSDDE